MTKTTAKPSTFLQRLSAAKTKIPILTESETGQEGNRKYQYVPLPVIVDACRPILVEHDLEIVFAWDDEGMTGWIVDARIEDLEEAVKTGIRCFWSFPDNFRMILPKLRGSELTYARRYLYHALLDLKLAGEDDDGTAANDAAKKRPKPKQKREKQEDPPKLVMSTQEQLDLLRVLGKDIFADDDHLMRWIVATCNKPFSDISFDSVNRIIQFVSSNKDPQHWPKEKKDALEVSQEATLEDTQDAKE